MQSIESDLTLAPKPKRLTTATGSKPEPERVDASAPAKISPIRTPAKASDQVNVTRSISFTTPIPMRDRLRQTAQDRNTTLTQLVLDAIEASIDQLGDLVIREQPAKTGGVGGLFPQREHPVSRSEETRVVVSLRIGSRNLRVVDGLVEKHRADNRSQLITAVLRDYLK